MQNTKFDILYELYYNPHDKFKYSFETNLDTARSYLDYFRSIEERNSFENQEINHYKEYIKDLLNQLREKNLSVEDHNKYVRFVEIQEELNRNDSVRYGCDCGCGGDSLDYDYETEYDNQLSEELVEINEDLSVEVEKS